MRMLLTYLRQMFCLHTWGSYYDVNCYDYYKDGRRLLQEIKRFNKCRKCGYEHQTTYSI
ncbi:MAG: hypothetical protein NVS3B25_32300 [Hymenobacter sp.]